MGPDPPIPPGPRLSFEGFTLDPSRAELRRGDAEVRLRPQTFEVLSLLVRRAGRLVTKEEMLETVWKGMHVTDDSLVQCVSELREALGDSSQTLIRTLPRRGYLFAAAVEPLPEPLGPCSPPAERTADTAGAPARRYRGGRGALVAAGLAAAALAAWVAIRQAGQAPPRTLAVLPFVPLGAGAEADDHLGVGMADALIGRLSSVGGLLVRPTSAITRVAGLPGPEVGRKLRVDYVLEGGLQRIGTRLRVTSQLISVADGSARWGDSFEIDEPDLFRVEDAIAERAAVSLLRRLSEGDRRALSRKDSSNPEARIAYRKGRFLWAQADEQALRASVEELERATSLDPGYALAHAGLAEALELLAVYGPADPRVSFQRAGAAAAKALELEPELAEAHASLAFVRAHYDHDWKAAEAGYRRALELAPGNAAGLQGLALCFAAQGRMEEAIDASRRALAADPLSLIAKTELGRHYHYARRYDEAIRELRSAVELDPAFVRAHVDLGRAYRQKGMHELALAELDRAVALSEARCPRHHDAVPVIALAELASAQAAARDAARAREILSRLQAWTACGYVSPYAVAVVRAGLGDTDGAIAALEEAYQHRTSWVVFLAQEPEFDAIRADPRFSELTRRMGVAGAEARAALGRPAAGAARP
jgi:DNA-binding winged helix-turn-helix (wHTH) protein/TolB-like protein